MEKRNSPQESRSLGLKIVSNLVLSVLVLSVGALCLAPQSNSVSVDADVELYRSSPNPQGVSLMFNVYWGTDEVYDILETLDAHDATATFFIGGCWADDNVECLRDIYTAGHEIGNHGYFHKNQDKLDFTQNRKEIADCNRFIELAIGEKPTLFAPPSGAYNEHTLSAAKLLDMKTVLWSKDTIDWRDKDEKLIYSRATKGVKNGDFILMHPMPATANALDDILIYYENNGLKPITVSENL